MRIDFRRLDILGRSNRVALVTAGVVAIVVAVVTVSVVERGLPARAANPPASTPSAGGDAADPAPGPTVVGTDLVRVTGAAAGHPSAPAVAQLLHRHFAAINAHDYDEWADTVVPRRARDQPRDKWARAYRSTVDESVVVNSLSATSTGLAAHVGFVSNQDLADAPAELRAQRICWSSTWPLVQVGEGLRIGAPERGATSKRAC
jgi:hypothetical protein